MDPITPEVSVTPGPSIATTLKRRHRRRRRYRLQGARLEQIAQRRVRVQKMSSMGMTVGQIADSLKVHRNTITTDLREIRNSQRKRVVDAEGFDELGEAITTLEEIERQAMLDVMAAKAGTSERNQLLRTAMTARLERTSLLQESGVIPKIADQLELSGMVEVLRLPTDALAQRRREIVARLREVDERGPVPQEPTLLLPPASDQDDDLE